MLQKLLSRTFEIVGTTSEKADRADYSDEIWPFSDQYSGIASEGHRLPPPSFGAPTLIWNFGIWKRQISEEKESQKDRERYQRMEAFDRLRKKKFADFDQDNVEFFEEISRFLQDIQKRGRPVGEKVQPLVIRTPQPRTVTGPGEEDPFPFRICEPQALAFTLWWQDEAGGQVRNERAIKPAPSSLRVRVQVQTHLDHATISFFVDVGKPYKEDPVFSSSEATGSRRRRIFEQVELVKRVCDRQIRSGHVDRNILSEQGLDSSDAEAIRIAADYWYVEIWREFVTAFVPGASKESPVFGPKSLGEVFANYRGVVLSVEGLATPSEQKLQRCVDDLRRDSDIETPRPLGPAAEANVGLGHFRRFDNKSGEANTVLKAYWPLIRRTAPEADDRDHVACGILDWRILYVSSLGSADEAGELDEASAKPAALPLGWFAEKNSSEIKLGRDRPIRYLLLSKGEPHRHQIGRFAERVNALGTMRLFALKDLDTIRNASVHIRILGHELDGILSEWSRKRRDVDDRWEKRIKATNVPASMLGKLRWSSRALAERRIQEINEQYAGELGQLIGLTDASLISLGAALDGIGQGGSGRLYFVMNRSRYFIGEFTRMLDTLEIGNVDTWIHYGQFVERGLKPTFHLIETTMGRLTSLRERLHSITQMIQTSALIVESMATQNNTATLSRIATRLGVLRLSAVLVIAAGVLVIATVVNWANRSEWFIAPICRHWPETCRSIGLEPPAPTGQPISNTPAPVPSPGHQ